MIYWRELLIPALWLRSRSLFAGGGIIAATPVRFALARGKKLHDKRETEKKRTWERERSRLMRDKG